MNSPSASKTTSLPARNFDIKSGKVNQSCVEKVELKAALNLFPVQPSPFPHKYLSFGLVFAKGSQMNNDVRNCRRTFVPDDVATDPNPLP